MAAASLVVVMVAAARPAAAAGDGAPVSVTPYSGFNPSLTRAPYVTDLGQTTAYVNWATTSKTPGSVLVEEAVDGVCPADIAHWSSAAVPVTTSLPGPTNPISPAPSASMTSWAFSVVNGEGVRTHEYQASVQVTALRPGTRYCYAVFSTNNTSAVDLLPPSQPYQTFTTLDSPGESDVPLTFDVLGDTGENYSYLGSAGRVPYPDQINPNQAALYQLIGASNARFLLIAGDIGYAGGTESSYGDLQQTGTTPEVSTIFGPDYFPQTGGIPTFAGDGNHGQSVTTLRNWPTPVTAAQSGGTYAFDVYDGTDGISGNFPDNWYAFSTGNVRIYMLDAAWADSATGSATGSACSTPSYCKAYQADYDEHWSTTSPEYQWLAQDLAEHPGGIKIAVFHYPLRSDNATQPSDPYLENIPTNPNSLEKLLADGGVGLVFNGHAHTYQRIIPHGVRQITNYVTGGGGGVLEPVLGGSTCAELQQTASVYALGWVPSSTVAGEGNGSSCGAAKPESISDVYHFLKVAVTGSTVTVTPINAAGQAFDVQSYTFSPTGTGPTAPTGLTATTGPAAGEIDLSWDTDPYATGYHVYRDGGATPIATIAATSFVDAGLPDGSQHTYTVNAFNGAYQESPRSDPVAGTAGTGGGAGVVTVPAVDDATISLLPDNTDTNYSTSSTLMVDGDQDLNEFLVRFTVPAGCTPTAASLTLTVGAGTNDGSTRGGDVYAAPGQWTTSTVTAANAPAAVGAPVSFGAVAVNTSYTLPITPLLPAEAGPGTAISLRVSTTSRNAAVYLSTRAADGATAGPRLTLSCSAGSAE